jgi:predicted MPP superfamily phosphohydrolase
MRLFLLTFFLIYGGMHLYAFLKARAAFAFGTQTAMFLMLFMVLMVVAPVLVRFSEKAGFETSARIMAYVGLTWGAILFLFFSASIVLDLYRGLLSLCGLVLQRSFPGITPSARYSFFIPLFVSLSIALYGFFEARDIRTERLIIRSNKIPKETANLKIVQISDVHLGLIVREDRLTRILRKVESERPDILVSTGDLVDGQICRLNGLEDPLKEIRAPYGKFAITGNHEFYAGFEETKCFTERAGFTLLRGEGVTPGGIINIAGVDDPAGKYFGLVKDIPEKALLSTLPRDKFTLLLKHRPFVDKESIGLFDLQLSGHVHKGQIFPFSLITKYYYPLHAGFMNLPNGSRLYVSRGSGTWGPPIRFLSPPEVTVIELVHSD